MYSNYYLTKGLAELGHEVYVSTTNANGRNKLDIDTSRFMMLQNNLYVKYYNETIIGRFSFSMMLNLWKDIKKADIVHSQDILSTVTVFALLFSKWYKKPIVLSPRGTLAVWCLKQGKLLSLFKRIWLEIIIKPFEGHAHFHATSFQEECDIKRVFPASRTVLSPNIIDLSKYRNSSSIDLNIFLEKIVTPKLRFKKFIVSIGRLDYIKGFDILIKSLKLIRYNEPETALLILGQDYGEKAKLKLLIAKLELADHVFLLGHIDGTQKGEILASADVFALTSRHENFGNVYGEALAAGTPIVASVHAPWQEVELAGCGKWVFLKEEKVAEAIIELFGEDRNALRKKSFEFSNRFSSFLIRKEMHNHYSSIIRGKKDWK